ncbi:MAG: 23S rRNA (adenine(2030)-N(6))-methyltransferase RlmJ [Devosia sp.]
MNYRHAFHAGSFTDVFKHAVLSRLIEYLKLKPGAFRVIDTHAGIGRYSLTGDEAKRSPEWMDGIARLVKAEIATEPKALLAPYLEAVASENRNGTLARYPGSPLLARKLFRPQDRLSALELHPADYRKLRDLFEGDVQVRVSELDGWLALNAFVPVKEKRGLVLVDPPFEEAGEWERLVDGLAKAHRKWATGLYALWYPIKERREVNAFMADLKATGITRILRLELSVDAPLDGKLTGSGMIAVNPPFVLEGEMKLILPTLVKALAPARGSHRIEWLRGEG